MTFYHVINSFKRILEKKVFINDVCCLKLFNLKIITGETNKGKENSFTLFFKIK